MSFGRGKGIITVHLPLREKFLRFREDFFIPHQTYDVDARPGSSGDGDTINGALLSCLAGHAVVNTKKTTMLHVTSAKSKQTQLNIVCGIVCMYIHLGLT